MSIPLLTDATAAAYDLLSWLVAALAPLDGGAAVAAAIVMLTALVRLALVPLSRRRARAQRPQAALLPALLQAPAFMVLYRVFSGSGSGTLLAAEVFGHPLTAAGLAAGWPLVALVAALAAVATVVAVRARRAGHPAWTLALPYLTIVPALFVPLAAGLYLATSTAWSAVENALLAPTREKTAG